MLNCEKIILFSRLKLDAKLHKIRFTYLRKKVLYGLRSKNDFKNLAAIQFLIGS